MVDYLITVMSCISFLFFVIGLILFIRAKGQAEILLSMKRLYLALGVAGSISLWLMLGDVTTSLKIIFVVLYLLLFWAMSFSYILGLFGIPLTSVRIQFLLTLIARGGKGANVKALMKDYSKESLVNIRLHRLMTSGEIVKKGNYYMLGSRRSYFVLHNLFLLFLLKLYRPFPRK